MKSVTQNLVQFYGISDIFPECSRTFKQLQVQDIMNIPCKKPDVEQVVSVSVTVEISYTNIIDTAKGISFEGQVLTGKKLIIEGKLHQKIEYVADIPTQPVHAAHFKIPFSTYIVLGEDMECYGEFDVKGYIEDIYVKQLDNRRIFKNVLFVLNAVPLGRV